MRNNLETPTENSIRNITCQTITAEVAALCTRANTRLSDELIAKLTEAGRTEISPSGKEILADMTENIRIAERENLPVCQDTGMAVVFLELGQDVHITGGSLEEAVNEGVSIGYTEGYLRCSVVADPLTRINTGDNTPAVIHTRVVPGNQLKITLLPKGFGAENTSALKMLKPSDGAEGVKAFITQAVITAAPFACAPLVVGVGVGGTFEKAALNAKAALTHPVGERSENPVYANLEREILAAVNDSGVGPMGLGGVNTLLDIHILPYATHIAGLPVAVNICCYVDRSASAVL